MPQRTFRDQRSHFTKELGDVPYMGNGRRCGANPSVGKGKTKRKKITNFGLQHKEGIWDEEKKAIIILGKIII